MQAKTSFKQILLTMMNTDGDSPVRNTSTHFLPSENSPHLHFGSSLDTSSDLIEKLKRFTPSPTPLNSHNQRKQKEHIYGKIGKKRRTSVRTEKVNSCDRFLYRSSAPFDLWVEWEIFERLGECLPDPLTTNQLKKCYRRLALRWHPDRAEGCSDKFHSLQMAYNSLKKWLS